MFLRLEPQKCPYRIGATNFAGSDDDRRVSTRGISPDEFEPKRKCRMEIPKDLDTHLTFWRPELGSVSVYRLLSGEEI